jgi:pSer/pThr/pTyr-binding forkhead associated (FHA) protein
VSQLPRPGTPRELQAVIAAERSGGPFLLYRTDNGELRVIAVAGAAVLTIGRGAGTTVPLAWDAGVSTLHAELIPRGGSWLLADDGLSRNGTFVNGERLQGRHRLKAGDMILIGHTTLAFHEGEEPAETTTAPLTKGFGPVDVTDAQRRVLVALCRPLLSSGGAVPLPATNQAIAEELFLSVEAVKTHLRDLYRRFGIEEHAQNEKRAILAHRAVELGLGAPPS